MAFNMNEFKNELKRYQRGVFAGVLVGLAAAYYTIGQGVDLSTIAGAGAGLLDDVFSRNASLSVEEGKLYLVFGVIGGVLGFIIDKFIPRTNKFFNKKRGRR